MWVYTPKGKGSKPRKFRFKDKTPRQKKHWSEAKCCHYCGKALRPVDASRDHKVPRCEGGTLDGDNRIISCKACNNQKNNMPYEVFIEWKCSLLILDDLLATNMIEKLDYLGRLAGLYIQRKKILWSLDGRNAPVADRQSA